MAEQKTEVVLDDNGKWVKKVYVLDAAKEVALTQQDALDIKKANFTTIAAKWGVDVDVAEDVLIDCVSQKVIEQCTCNIK